MSWTEEDLQRLNTRREKNAANVEANRKAVADKMRGKRDKPVYRIGIDPAFRKGGIGVCVIDPNGALSFPRFGSKKNEGRGLIDLCDWLRFEAPQEAVITIEDSNLQNSSFDRSGGLNVAVRKARNVGANQAVSDTIVEAAKRRWGEDRVNAISPQQKGKKWTKPMFAAILKKNNHKQPGKYRQDDIDAYQLATKNIK